MLKKILRELTAIRKELQDIKLILKFRCLRSNYEVDAERVGGKRVIKGRRILSDPLEELRKEERTLQQYRENKIEYLPNR